ncbi:MAG TPA: DNA polymerase ligase N-terminal domain-containing protein [Acidimicrobiales bacterium]|nr:DNA polymerase ligase N-terminal domain-containing protein [Acidimicrobiales bacterium]
MARRRAEPPLSTYRAKRDFDRTPEPAGDSSAPTAGAAPRFVVQRHRARRRHYDLRFEVDGVLASWAVPKGPTLDPGVRRLAVHVEDHPIEYLDFEGVIPAGEYGGGDVIVWDIGTWSLTRGDDARAEIDAGELHVEVSGEKLAGRFALVRSRRGRSGSGQDEWLLVHADDDHAVRGWDAEDHPRSVLSGRTNDEVAADPEWTWRSDTPAAEARVRVGAGDGDAPADEARVRSRSSSGDEALASQAVTDPSEWRGPTDDELAALDALGSGGRWTFVGRELKLTNLDKALFPGRDGSAPVTKRDLVRYHALVAPTVLPYLAGRPVNTNRFPAGVDEPGFWHTSLPSHAPDWISRWDNPDAGKRKTHAVVDHPATLAWLANFAAVELHAWTARVDDVSRPTWALFDIDPGTDTTFDEVVALARLHRTALDHLGVVGRPKVTGRRGVQIWVPIEPRYSFEETRAWAETISRAIGATLPELVSWEWRVDARGGRARLDYTQNAANKTLVAPYSARPSAGAPVSVPIEWDELDDPDLRPDRWTVRTVVDRIAEVGDPFRALLGVHQELPSLT